MTVEQSCLANRPIPELMVVRHPEFLSSFDISQAYTSKDRGFSSFTLYFPTENNKTGKLEGVVPLLVSTQIKAYRSRMPVNFSSLCSQLMVRETPSTTGKKKDLSDCFKENKHKHEVNDNEHTVILWLDSVILKVFSNLNPSTILYLCSMPGGQSWKDHLGH